jgi:hypothetical protein
MQRPYHRTNEGAAPLDFESVGWGRGPMQCASTLYESFPGVAAGHPTTRTNPLVARDHRDAKERLNLRNHCNFVILFRAACLLLVKIPARGVQLGGLYGDLAR